MKYCLALIAVLVCCISTAPTEAANPDLQNYRHAFALIDAGRALDAEVFARHGHDPVLNKVIHGIAMAQPGTDASFEEMSSFIANNPDWPNLKGIEAIAEQKLPANWAAAQIVAWFTAHPPQSINSFYRYADSVAATDPSQVADLVHTRWVDGEFTTDEMAAFRMRYRTLVGQEEIWSRLDRLLWKGDAVAVRQLYPILDPRLKSLAEARLALASRTTNAEAAIARLPADVREDPGLLYERLRLYVHNNQDAEALDILHHMPDNFAKPEAWWEQRQIMARRLLVKKDYEEAYRLAANHGALKPKQLADAEFLCGWIALRFLNEQDEARQHFQKLYDVSATPISRARGAYWLGRTYEEHGDHELAQQAYQTAAALNITYYGQLAATAIDEHPVIAAMSEPPIPLAVRNAFYNRDLIRAVERLSAIGEHDLTHNFFRAATEAAAQRADFALLTELAYRIARPDYAVEAGKAATKKNMLITAGGFPLLDRKLPANIDPAFLHALIRQESMFNTDAHSPAGAQGLMQLMIATAREVAKKLGIHFKPNMLSDPDYNLRLGSEFAAHQLSGFDGSYVLALAGYNAGPRRVREWMTQIGDPRHADVDVIDWIEQIPVYETRNYVQRIMESMQIYRARLSGGQAPLTILKDLKR